MGAYRRRPHRVVVAMIIGVLGVLAGAVAAHALSSDFVDEVVLSGLNQPSNIEFAADGTVFVAEKGGTVKVYDSISDTTPTVFADLGVNVHNFWDRGLLGLAIHPNYPIDPYVYVLYTFDAPIGGSPPTWGDACANPPGATDDGCVVSGRLSRLTAAGDVMTGDELVLIEDWCQQYPSHSIGDLEFGADGALYATAGDGASFNWVDYGQGGGDAGSPTPENPCGDPPVPVGGDQTTPDAEGGALRSQDLLTGSDPVTLDGTVIRIDPETGEALPDNPLAGHSDPNAARIVAHGLRNPFRLAVRPGTNEIFTGDVGWSTWEEVNHHPTPAESVLNFGWPCYEGGNGTPNKQGGYDSRDLTICEGLYSTGSVSPALFAYRHDSDITDADLCPPANPPQGTSSSISGLAFYEGGEYPGLFNGALFGSDYSRDCVWVMYTDADGDLDPSTVEVFQHQARNPVDLEAGPDGDIYYVDINGGDIRRFRFVGSNTPPVASISANPTSGSAPLTVDFDASGSSDADLDPIVSFEWDFDDDGLFDDAAGATPQWTFDQPGSHAVRLLVTDSRGETDTDTLDIQASNSPPAPVIDDPGPGLLWHVGEDVSFSGHANDPDEGLLPASSLDWEMILHHCEDDGSCHIHSIQSFPGVASGSFQGPDHEYPSWIELRLTATDQFGVEATATVELQPELVDLTFETSPAGLDLTFLSSTEEAPFAETVIVGSTVDVSAPSHQQDSGQTWSFESWSNGGDRAQTFSAPAVETTYTAVFNAPPTIETGPTAFVSENQSSVLDIDSSDNSGSEGAGLFYSLTNGPDQALFDVLPNDGTLTFNSAPDFELPQDSNSDNTYEVDVTVIDSGGLSDSKLFEVTVVDVDETPLTVDDAYQTDEDETLNVNGVLDNDTDPESQPLDATLVTDVTHGTLHLDPDGTFTYTPDPDWNGTDTFTYETCDPANNCDTATTTITVTPVNDPPAADDDADTTPEDTQIAVDVSNNDTDIDDPLDLTSINITSGPANGNANPNPDGTITYTPDPNWNGTDTLQYTIDDQTGDTSNQATVTIEVGAVDDPPVALDDHYETDEDVALDVNGVLDNDTDPESQTLDATLATDVTNGTLHLDPDGTFTYTPDPDWNGTDTFTYETCDSGNNCDTATATITVTPVNDPPTADAGPDRGLIIGETADLDGSGSDDPAEGSSLAFSWSIVTAPSGSAATISDPVSELTTFTPDRIGTYEIQLEVSDGEASDTDATTLTVSQIPNDPPMILSSANQTVVEGQVTVLDIESSDDHDQEKAGLIYTRSGGDDVDEFVIDAATGVLSFVEAPSYASPSDEDGDSVYYVEVTVTDSKGLSDAITLEVTVKVDVLGPGEGDSVGVVDSTTGMWYLRDALTGETESFYYGVPYDYPIMGDWDCDGVDTPGQYRQSDGYVYLRNSNTQGVADVRFFFGIAGDVPIAGDWNGNGCDTVSIYRPSEGRVYIINELGADEGGLGEAELAYYFGVPADKPFPGDFDDDGVDEVGLHRESTGLVYFRYTHTQGVADETFVYGIPGDLIVAGEWAQLGLPGPDTVGIYRPGDGWFYLRFSNDAGLADVSFTYGNPDMRPVAGNFGALDFANNPPPS